MEKNLYEGTVNTRISETRSRLHLTQAEMAEKMGMNRTAYAYMEKHGNISAEKISKIAEILGVTVDYLVNGQRPDVVILKDSQPVTPWHEKPETFLLTEGEKKLIKMLRMLPRAEASKIRMDVKTKFDDYFKNF